MIRDACAEDFLAVTAITNHYIQTSTIHFAYEPLAPGYLHGVWERDRQRYPWVVAAGSGANHGVVGYAKSGAWRDRAAYAWTTEIGLYVAEAHQRQGLGRALYERLLDELARRGFRSAIAGITLPNDPSRALHEAFGFISVGVVRDAGYKTGAWHDVEFFQKRFTTGAESPR